METDLSNVRLLFSKIIGTEISNINHIYIEFVGYSDIK